MRLFTRVFAWFHGVQQFTVKRKGQNISTHASIKSVVIYSRVSTGGQDCENQLAQLRQYAASQGWEVVGEYTDVVSGSASANARKGLGTVLTLAHRHKFDLLLYWSLDRLSREGSRKTIELLTRLEACGVQWHSYTEPYLSSLGIFGDAIIALLGALAKQERVRISERTKAGLEQARARGQRLGRPPCDAVKVQEARSRRLQGQSFSEIGQAVGLSRSRVHQLLQATA